MEIDGKNIQTDVNSCVKQVDKPQRVEATGKRQTPPRPQGDTVAISDAAKALQQIEKAVKDIPEVREDKVAEIRNQLAQGTYKVDGQRIAFNMLKEAVFNEKA